MTNRYQHGPPTDSYLSFVSPRKPARTPIYINPVTIIFIPEAVPIDPSNIDENIIYCESFEILPV
tara:strand:- start:1978 stop:2172 length:195 start_codon:yes stop_codon:yes gene_type:complete